MLDFDVQIGAAHVIPISMLTECLKMTLKSP